MEAGKSKIVEAVWSYQSRRYPREEADGGKLAEWQLELMERAMRWEKPAAMALWMESLKALESPGLTASMPKVRREAQEKEEGEDESSWIFHA
jgi:hypothetical protein